MITINPFDYKSDSVDFRIAFAAFDAKMQSVKTPSAHPLRKTFAAALLPIVRSFPVTMPMDNGCHAFVFNETAGAHLSITGDGFKVVGSIVVEKRIHSIHAGPDGKAICDGPTGKPIIDGCSFNLAGPTRRMRLWFAGIVERCGLVKLELENSNGADSRRKISLQPQSLVKNIADIQTICTPKIPEWVYDSA